ncbi:MAG: hypothetical protein H6R05_135 [Burkholderiaceae bacterium]|nr:hypothetical protein [Burkholderiaceae bacterium]
MKPWYLSILVVFLSIWQVGCMNTVSSQKDLTGLYKMLDNDPNEAKKFKIVSRMYQATDDMLVYCSKLPPEQLDEHKKTVAQLWNTFPKYRELILNSPYYPIAQQKNHSKPNEYGLAPEVYQTECKYYQDLIQDITQDSEQIKSDLEILEYRSNS